MNELLYKQPSIFIADDDTDDVYFVRSAIAELDDQINLKHFLNGKQLLAALNSSNEGLPNFVLMDLNMPIMDGKETLKTIRKSSKFNDLPVIILSTSNHASEKDTCFAYGATNYITKPYNYARYLDILKKLKNEWIDDGLHHELHNGELDHGN